jgi:hypothetical protein
MESIRLPTSFDREAKEGYNSVITMVFSYPRGAQ